MLEISVIRLSFASHMRSDRVAAGKERAALFYGTSLRVFRYIHIFKIVFLRITYQLINIYL